MGADVDMIGMIHDAMGIPINDHQLELEQCESFNDKTQNFFNLLQIDVYSPGVRNLQHPILHPNFAHENL